MRPIIAFALVAVVIAGPLLGFGLNRVFLSADEAQALWVVEDVAPPNADLIGEVRANVSEMIERVQAQPQPPLYFFALEAWTLLLGASLFVARAFSLICALLAAAVIGLTAWQHPRRTDDPVRNIAGLLALLLMVYPATQAYVYGLLLLWMALATWALLRWARQPTLFNGVLYTICLAMIFYTAHVLIFVVALHGLYALRYGLLLRYAVAVVAAGIAFVPWLLFFQTRALPMPDFLQTTAIAVAVVAAVPLLIELPGWISADQRVKLATGAVVAVVIAGTSVLLLSQFAAPGYVSDVQRLREPDQPVLIDFAPREPLRYLNAQSATGIAAGLSIDLSWRDLTPDVLTLTLESIDSAAVIWLMLPAEADYVTQITRQLETAGWSPGYIHRDGLLIAQYVRGEV